MSSEVCGCADEVPHLIPHVILRLKLQWPTRFPLGSTLSLLLELRWVSWLCSHLDGVRDVSKALFPALTFKPYSSNGPLSQSDFQAPMSSEVFEPGSSPGSSHHFATQDFRCC